MRRIVLAVVPALLLALGVTVPVHAAAPTCDGREATIVGTSGNDTIVGTPEADVIVAKGGRDTVKGRGGRDRICGGSGDDRLVGGGGTDRLFGGSGYDALFGGAGHDLLYGFDGIDVLYGNTGNDTLRGGASPDFVYGGAGADSLFGDAGDDTLDGGDGTDSIDGGADSDRCTSGGAEIDLFVDCETSDLSVDVMGPESAVAGQSIAFTITVHNHGDVAMAYEVRPTYTWTNATCTFSTWGYLQPPLDPGADAIINATMNCAVTGGGASASLRADLVVHGIDPVAGNNSDTSATVPISNQP